MRIPRFHCPAASASKPGDVVELDSRESHHLIHVLRRAPGDAVRLLPGDGREWEGTVSSAGPGPTAWVRIERAVDPGDAGAAEALAAAERGRVVASVAVALARGGAFELTLEHLAELGADEIIPLQCSRCVVRLSGVSDIEHKMERWRRILESASKQSGRRALPVLRQPVEWREWIERERVEREIGHEPGLDSRIWVATPENTTRFLFEEAADWLSRTGVVPAEGGNGLLPVGRVVCAIGPEGGFSPEEVRFALDRGAAAAWLGDHVLRVPTAAAAAMTAIRLAIRQAAT